MKFNDVSFALVDQTKSYVFRQESNSGSVASFIFLVVIWRSVDVIDSHKTPCQSLINRSVCVWGDDWKSVFVSIGHVTDLQAPVMILTAHFNDQPTTVTRPMGLNIKIFCNCKMTFCSGLYRPTKKSRRYCTIKQLSKNNTWDTMWLYCLSHPRVCRNTNRKFLWQFIADARDVEFAVCELGQRSG